MNELSKKVLFNFNKNLRTRNDKQFLFWSRSVLHAMIVNFLFCAKDKMNLESICRTIPKRVGSRTTIYEVLQQGLDEGHLIKSRSDKDKRLRLYEISPELKKVVIEQWEAPNGEGLLSKTQ